MRFHEDINELIVELLADIQDIGNEQIWAFYEEENDTKIFTDYRFKQDPDEKMPKGTSKEKVTEILASDLLSQLRAQHFNNSSL
ncbi:hypothetical protein [Enterococcus mediterraneensis]|uniref:hypothetical protein n=1 Tax=Enterococcus mediterraneensis TaxID=2364791 RepID=UPI000F064EDB|nr:hypothetical protein [Enterococcus mediterraneensis]